MSMNVRAGQVHKITSTANPIVKSLKGLAIKKNRERSKTFLAEGLKLATDALSAGWEIRTIVFNTAMADNAAVAQLNATARARGASIIEASEKVLSSLTRRDNPQMVVGEFVQQCASLDQIAATSGVDWLVLDRVRDPGNLGTTIRTVDAAGFAGLILVGDCTDIFASETVRATMGSLFHVPIIHVSLDRFVDWHKTWLGQSIGTHLSATNDYRSVAYGRHGNLLLMGNEQHGLPDRLAELCDVLVQIPMAGEADSLNLAVATGIMAFEVKRHLLEIDDQ